jgi:predicted phosphate transport protein (TIGR00153 family)
MAKKKSNYYEMFVAIAEDAIKAAQHLEKTVKDFNYTKSEKLAKSMHEIEHGADLKKHELMKTLADEFMTPIEREDIVTLAWELDDVLDYIEEVFQLFFMFNIQEMRPQAIDFAELIVRSTTAMKVCFDEFHNFRRSKTIGGKIIEVNIVEELADVLFIKAMRELYTKEKDPVKVNAWCIIFDKLEKICDRCEHVADTIESVIMKNT